jgi:hypothetical protein
MPADVGPTPPLGTCCEGDKGKCAPTASWWEHPTWQALNFAVEDPHYFSYQFSSQTVDGRITFTVRALGDLDCDGVYSTYEMVGRADPGGSPAVTTEISSDNEFE